ncbi:MAG: hypothetical protein ABIT76_08740 [Chthoniobacterales bacterium]
MAELFKLLDIAKERCVSPPSLSLLILKIQILVEKLAKEIADVRSDNESLRHQLAERTTHYKILIRANELNAEKEAAESQTLKRSAKTVNPKRKPRAQKGKAFGGVTKRQPENSTPARDLGDEEIDI